VSIIHVTHAEKCDNPSEGHGLASSGLSSDDKVSETEEKHLLSQRVIRSDDTHHSFVNEGSAARPVELVFVVNVLKCDGARPGCAAEIDKNVSKNFVKAVVAGLPVGNAQTDARVAVLQMESVVWGCHTEISLQNGTSHSEINKAVDQMGFYDSGQNLRTTSWNGINIAFHNGKPNAKKVLVVLSNRDFNHFFNRDQWSSSRLGIDFIMAIGVGPEVTWQDQVGFNKETLEYDRAFHVQEFVQLRYVQERTIRMICEEANCPINGS